MNKKVNGLYEAYQKGDLKTICFAFVLDVDMNQTLQHCYEAEKSIIELGVAKK
jgi:hypothetical protein